MMDRNKHGEERRLFAEIFRTAFPALGEEYEVLQPSVAQYNCIAYTLGITNAWLQPETGSAEAPLALMDAIYGEYEFVRTPTMQFDFQTEIEKVVLYGLIGEDGSIDKLTHAALQNSSGAWESKVGQGPLIRHATPQALSGPLYGEPVALYVRNR